VEHAVAPFTFDAFDPEAPFIEESDVQLGRVKIAKTFTGDLEATSSVEMLSARSDSGAGYVALEWVNGRLRGREGGFALLHLGTMENGEQWAKWPISPGSGTGELTGISGEGRIEISEDGSHTLFLDYELP
jgi:Protein of unknown function (DUF3224)